MNVRGRSIGTEPAVDVLVLNYNGRQWLRNCLETLRRTTYPSMNAWVVDNGSADGSIDYVRETFPDVGIVSHERNHGFAAGYNLAMEKMEGKYAVFLNNDIKVANPEWLSEMVQVMESQEQVAAIAAKLVMMDNARLIDAVGGTCYPWARSMNIGFMEEDKGQYDSPAIEPFAACGAAMMVRSRAFHEVGGFDTGLFAYCEDLDLCWRLRLRGYTVVYQPTAVIHHHFSGFWGKQPTRKHYLSARNFLRTMLKNYSSATLPAAVLAFMCFTVLLRLFGYLALRQPGMAWAMLAAVGWNIGSLGDTIKQRRLVQSTRVVPDSAIYRAMGKPRVESPLRMVQQARYLSSLYDR